MPKKIKIPKELFMGTIALLDALDDIEDYPPETVQLYGYLLYAFNQKKANIELRKAFKGLSASNDRLSRLQSFGGCSRHACDDVLF